MESGVVFKVNDRNREELSREEIAEFVNSLNEEKEFFPMAIQGILKYEVIVGAEVNGTLVGVSGINRMLGLPNGFSAVRSDFQGRRIGDMLMERKLGLAKDNYDFFIAKVWKKNVRIVALERKWGYRFLYENRELHIVGYPANLRGKIICYMLRCLLYVSGPFVLWLAKKFSSGSFA